MRRFLSYSYFAAFLLLAGAFSVNAQLKNGQPNTFTIDLSGNWGFKTDSLDKGIEEHWYKEKLSDVIHLPGSMTTNDKGDDVNIGTKWTGSIFDSSYFHKPEYAKYRVAGNVKVPFWLQPVKYYKGAAWYQKEVNIPATWKNRYLELYIERSHWETTVWVDNKKIGVQNSLATAQMFDLTNALSAGKHRLTIRVDNRIKDIDFGQNSHSLTDHTQTNWNGMIGQLYLKARPLIFIKNVQLFPNISKRSVSVKLQLNNISAQENMVKIRLSVRPNNKWVHAPSDLIKMIRVQKDSSFVTLDFPMGKSPLLWSEFHPSFYRMLVTLTSSNNQKDEKPVIFGMREFKTKGTQFTINGQATFLRGALECAVFPKTGYPPTDVASWVKEFSVYKAYGLNHLRFHSWCPPEAAFEAADGLGLYLHIECSSWANQGATIGDGKPLDQYIYDESNRIVEAYGNHPSFCMMDYGNEPAGKGLVKYLTAFVKYWQEKDPRRLYTTGSGWPTEETNDYNITPEPRIQHWGEGLKSIINNQRPGTDYDWSAVIANWKRPTVSHEIGQWCVYPDFSEINKYTGVLKAKNFEIFRDKLKENGLAGMASKFLYASGKLQVLCYKADIEAALRTRGFAGFQLLGLYDFPGQGTALVGVVNAFGGDKGYTTGAQYSQFCNSVVPLARLSKMVWLNNETLTVPVEIAQFGTSAIKDAIPKWEIKNAEGLTLFSGKLAKTNIPIGNGIKLGTIGQPLNTIKSAERLTLTIHVGSYNNSWDIFVYPANLPKTDPNIYVTQFIDAKAEKILSNGGKVLLTLKKGELKPQFGGDIAIGFSSIFWNTAWTHQQPPVTMGILCDPKNPALSKFPTQSFSNWQWWDAMSHSNAICLDSVAKGLHPIVRVIDDWVTARSLGLIFECKAGRGSLIVSGIDLITNKESRPEARQLLFSLENYMAKSTFSPMQKVDLNKIKSLY